MVELAPPKENAYCGSQVAKALIRQKVIAEDLEMVAPQATGVFHVVPVLDQTDRRLLQPFMTAILVSRVGHLLSILGLVAIQVGSLLPFGM